MARTQIDLPHVQHRVFIDAPMLPDWDSRSYSLPSNYLKSLLLLDILPSQQRHYLRDIKPLL
jgi:hypothetical protein